VIFTVVGLHTPDIERRPLLSGFSLLVFFFLALRIFFFLLFRSYL